MTVLADTGLWTTVWFYLSWVVPFLFVLGVVVFIHEMGHFLVARYFGVTVETFSIGFGPEIGGFYDRQGTRWRVAWVPLGGYVKFKGDENAASVPSQDNVDALSEEERRGNFHAKPVGQRAAVVAAGPLANFILALIVFTGLFFFYGKPILEPRVLAVTEGSSAVEAGFQAGDVIRSVEGSEVESRADVMRVILLNAETDLSFQVERGGSLVNLTATPALTEIQDALGNKARVGRLGLQFEEPRITEVVKDSAAESAGFQTGDIIRKVNEKPIEGREDVIRIVSPNAGNELSIVVERDGQLVTLTATPATTEVKDRYGQARKIGRLGIVFEAERPVYKELGPIDAFSQSLSETYFWLKQPVIFIQKLVTQQASGEEVRGIIGIAQLSREVASFGFVELIRWIAIISINIGLLNLFPIPMLDGGHLLFYGIEAIRGRPLSERTMEIGFRIGFALVIMLMLFATRNDVIHLWRQMG